MNGTGKEPSSCADAVPTQPFSSLAGIVYFASCKVPDYPIKIGWTTDMTNRLPGLRMGLPHELVILLQIPGSPDYERQLHMAFHFDRIRGEWFKRSPELMDFIHLNKMPKGML